MLRTAPLLALAFASTATAQSVVWGVNIRGNDSFTTDVANFVANYNIVGGVSEDTYAVDFDATATTFYAIDNATLDILTMDLGTGTMTPTGNVATITGVTGMTADPNGTDWWVSEYNANGDSELYRGDINTGVFSLVGIITTGSIMIDIAMDSNGNLYGYNISDDSLYEIDTTTGAGTVVGPIGLNGNFAQGMDFDWSNDTLYATVYTGGGTGKFCTLDLSTGLATQLEDTFSLNAEMEIAIQQPASTGPGPIGSAFCAANPNSTGAAGVTVANGSTAIANNNVTLQSSSLPPTQFGIYVVSSAVTAGTPVGSGVLCLGGSIGRYQSPGQILQVNAAGEFSLAIDLGAIPQGVGTVATMAGDTWAFQAWHRDVSGGMPTSNFTNGVSITFN